MRAVLQRVLRRTPPAGKHASELAFWRERLAVQGDLAQSNALYARCFTELFDVPEAYYADKRMLDVGCGPRGSLEWAGHAAERVGIDPLADEYVRLHTTPQAMTYVRAGCEEIPFPDGHFDVVSTINSLDHVDDVDAAIAEITRVARPGGRLLLLVDVNHEPTPTEPHRLGWDLPERFTGWTLLSRRDFARPGDNMYDNLFGSGQPYDHDAGGDAPGVLTALLERAATSAGTP